jgi:hypothetical protein
MLLIITLVSVVTVASLVTGIFGESYKSLSFRAQMYFLQYGKVELIEDICKVCIICNTCITCNRDFFMFLRDAHKKIKEELDSDIT